MDVACKIVPTQEDRDLRLAIALQQEENEAAIAAAKSRSSSINASKEARTSRSGVHSKLAAIRSKDMGMLRVPKEYTTENAYSPNNYSPPGGPSMSSVLPGERSDFALASELQKVEDTAAAASAASQKLSQMTVDESKSSAHRTGWSEHAGAKLRQK
mmetsp:Transcript_27997/g.64092  ORF Transcript_27997/g.64092 Transcript_27997/m.64092 type:complete len:157 (-) Transcript_27997:191-661(-)|eukprot:CAMPEP_0113330688 /NCGR_PEP_ID=MMETSP0010_2-20120614/21860_1 /TAXON_ID=216773 ORGANISM="Corethron hystrix, Strain 308" /NCGR_SAMPLE_ID=MMETSP0010_2 /ASSEMBLY_ACC=CAM_ASM_000155 /LENGTH=156 /DNA_ID=CAMNT_0000193447 /DNA_START=111 /DNA_END=581 /DNA_ORIENTATION=+ /assembly_acc=CAM_ASM_000155